MTTKGSAFLWVILVATLLGLTLGLIAVDCDLKAQGSALGLLPQNHRGTPVCKVVRVIDGDTVVLLLDGKETTVRLIGVDTPETVHPHKSVESYGKEASRFTENLLKGESVKLEYESGVSKLDKYGRTLAYLYRVPDGLFVNLEIVRQGYGHAYTQYPFQYMEQFRSYERAAREAEKGLWGPDVPGVSAAGALATPQVVKGSETQSTEQTEEVTVYITRSGAKYHRAGCRYLRKSTISISLKDARGRYTPCSVCSPPQ